MTGKKFKSNYYIVNIKTYKEFFGKMNNVIEEIDEVDKTAKRLLLGHETYKIATHDGIPIYISNTVQDGQIMSGGQYEE